MDNHSLIQALQNPTLYNHPIIRFEVIETHLSFILLTGLYAYKIKKNIDLKFADFSTLEKRYFYCQEELRLNRRLAPSLYLEVIAIQGDVIQDKGQDSAVRIKSLKNLSSHPHHEQDILQDRSIIEYAVQMKQFDQNNLFSVLITKEPLPVPLLQSLAKTLAEFHQSATISDSNSPFGSLTSIQKPMLENFSDSKKLLQDIKEGENCLTLLSLVEKLCVEEFSNLKDAFLQRKQIGFIRECHGDCHLGNIVLIQGKPLIFDCIEFNESFRWIDTIDEIAFLMMDLQARSHSVEASFCFLNAYLEKTGDYSGLKLLRFYQSYRAMVRAKVALLTQKTDRLAEFTHYLKLCQTILKKTTPRLMITYGVSGSGKTWLASKLAAKIPAIHLRSDIERQRMKIPKDDRYSPKTHQKVYQHLLELAKNILEEGYSVIVDATFLQHQDRNEFQELAKQLNIDFTILQCEADTKVLQDRISMRLKENQDASEANLEVLEKQFSIQEPLQDSERRHCIVYNPTQDIHSIFKAFLL